MKEFLKKLIADKQKRADELRKKIDAATDLNEARADYATLEALNAELAEAMAALKKVEDDEANNGADEGRSFNPLASYGMRSGNPANKPDAAMEARLAFANFVTRGVLTPEMRADATTKTTAVTKAIPENLLNQIIEKIDAVGIILPLVTRTSYPVGQTIPTDAAKPTASWVSEGATSDAQAKGTLGSIVFGAFKLRCEIRMTQEVTVQTISAFETLFVKQVSEAMVKAIEGKIVSADAGAANPTGILYRASGTDATVTVAKGATGKLTYKLLCDAEAELPQQYEGGAKWFMSKKTFMQFIGMTDTQGQPIARVNYGIGGKPERMLLGREVVLTGTYLSDYTEATAAADVCFAFLFDPSDYVLNTSYDLGIQRKQDWDTEDHCVKAVMSVDGKVIDRNSLVKLVKAYA
jgi:HK97 family phage major capsid protein